MWHFTNNLVLHQKDTHSIKEMLDLFCKGASLYGPFWNHKEPKIHLKRLAEFIECPFSIEEETSGVVDEILKMYRFENLSNLEVNTNGKFLTGEAYKFFFHRGEIGD
ncbi:hypothetical protein R3W88_019453 [Solanum pinnatisectum]|uniref:Sulfotransferase n=1 Tax=Solanum pinnatisectum TaxID=50273 RepID=A0AAV9KJD0_9SOLN|nr:hypothetical protein R3W88_019453 [Solanum pinnatisectum]